MEITAQELAQKIGGTLKGDPLKMISGINELKGAKATDVSFVLEKKYAEEAKASSASVILSDSVDEIEGKTVIKVGHAKAAYVAVINIFYPEPPRTDYRAQSISVSASAKIGAGVAVHDFAVIGDGAVIEDNVIIGAGCFVGADCRIGKNTVLDPNVTLYAKTVIGESTIIHSGVTLGGDGFGFVPYKGGILKVPQIGYVKIGSYVEIGNNCCVDRGAFGPTVIGNMVKIDNLVHIAHNVQVGDGTIIVAQTGVAGSTKIGMGCVIGGQVGITDHIEIGDFAQIGSQAGVSKDIPAKAVVTGTPAKNFMDEKRSQAYIGKLAVLFDRVKAIEAGLKKENDEK
jgi:UDP-3-O-[3-hydroxymyristoyl] glucosamine N-acyltransferase